MVAPFFVAMILPRAISECKCESFFLLTSWTKTYFSDSSKTGCPENFLNPRTARVPAVTLGTFSRLEPNGHNHPIISPSSLPQPQLPVLYALHQGLQKCYQRRAAPKTLPSLLLSQPARRCSFQRYAFDTHQSHVQ